MYQVGAGQAQELNWGVNLMHVGTRCPQAARQEVKNCRAQTGHPAGLKAPG